MSLIRDALNKAQQEQDAARTGQPLPRHSPGFTPPPGGSGPGGKALMALVVLGALMGCAALVLQLTRPSNVGEPHPAQSVASNTPAPSAPAVVQVPVMPTPAPTPHPTPVPTLVASAPVVPPPPPPVSHPVPPVTASKPAQAVASAPTAAPRVDPPPHPTSSPTPPTVVAAAPVPPAPAPVSPASPPPNVAVVPAPPQPAPAVATAPAAPAPASQAASEKEPSQDLIEFVDQLAIRAVMVRPGGNRASILGRVFQVGDFLPGAPKPLKVVEIGKDHLTFSDNAGNAYTKRL